METLSSALKRDYSKGTPAPKDPSPQKEAPPLKKNDRPPERSEFPVLVLEKDTNNQTTILKNELYTIDTDTALSFLNFLYEQAESSGVLKEYHLRYIVRHAPDGSIKYALADIYAEENALKWQIIHSILIGSAALAVFFLISVLLSNWAIRPVALTWKQQQFIADAAHELKTPLTVILSNTGMILQTPECEISEHTIAENQNRTQRIHEEAIRMKHLVESLLFLARSDSGQIPAAFRNFDLSYIINSSILAFEPVAFELGKEIRSQIENSIQLHGDDTRIRQLADILLDNACKYSADNTTITVRLTAANAKEALLTVTSEGTPLSAYDIQHIFLRFYRADPSRSETSGHGLGLPIAQSIV